MMKETEDKPGWRKPHKRPKDKAERDTLRQLRVAAAKDAMKRGGGGADG